MSDNTTYEMTNKGAALLGYMRNNAERLAEFDDAFDAIRDYLFFSTYTGTEWNDAPEATVVEFQKKWDDDADDIQHAHKMCIFAGKLTGNIALAENKSIEEALALAKKRFVERFHEGFDYEDDDAMGMD